MKKQQPKAIVFNCHYNGLSIIQTLAKENIECIAMDSKRSIGTYSRYGKYIKCPDPLNDEKGFVEFLYDFCSREPIKPILYPTNDHWAAAISKHKKMLKDVSIPNVADWETVKILLEKESFYKLGSNKNFLTPQTWEASKLNTIEERHFPIIAKPEYRRMPSNKNLDEIYKNLDRLRLVKLDNRSQLEAFVKREEDYIDYMLFQEYVPGMSNQMYTIGVYANENSDILGMFIGKKVRGFPADIGDCIIGEATDVPDSLVELTKRITKEINYQGIAEFEFKRDDLKGEYKLIEINPRSWSWIGITPYAGVNLPLIAYNDLTNIQDSDSFYVSNTHASVAYIKLFEDFLNVAIRYRWDYPAWNYSIKSWINSLRKYERLVIAEFNMKDYPVTVVSFARTILNPILSLVRRKKRIKE